MIARLLKIFGGLLGLLLLAVVLLLIFFPTERIRLLAEEKASAQLQAPVTIGDLSLQILGGVGLTLQEIQVGQEARPEMPQIHVDGVTVEVALWPLLSKELVVRSVLVERPVVHALLPDADAAEAPKVPEAGPERSSGENEFSLVLERFRLVNGALRVSEVDGQTLLELDGIHEDLSARFEATGDVLLTGHTRVEQLRLNSPAGSFGQGLVLTLEKEIRYSSADDLLSIQQATLQLGEFPVRAQGKLSELSSAAAKLDLSLQGGPVRVEEIMAFLPASLFPSTAEVQSAGELELNAKLKMSLGEDAAPPVYDLSLHLRDGLVRYGGDLPPLHGIELQAQVNPAEIRISKLEAQAGASQLQIQLGIRNHQSPEASFAGHLAADLHLGELSQMHPAAAELALGGKLRLKLQGSGHVTTPEEAAVEGRLELEAVTARTAELPGPVRELNALAMLTKNKISIERLSLAVLDSDLSLQGKLANPLALVDTSGARGRAWATLQVQSQSLDLDQLFPPDPEKDKRLEPLPPLDGHFDFEIARFVSNKIESREVAGTATLKDGVISVEAVRLRTLGGTVNASGELNLRKPLAPTYTLEAKLQGVQVAELVSASPAFASFGGFATGFSGKLDGAVSAAGNLDDTLGVDLASLTSESDWQCEKFGIQGLPLQASLANYLSAPDLATLIIPSLRQHLQIKDGKLSFKDLAFASHGSRFRGAGNIALDGELDLSFDVELPSSQQDKVRKLLPADLARLLPADQPFPLPLRITGAAVSPKVSLNQDRAGQVIRAQAKDRLAAEQQKLQKAAGAKAEELAAELLGGLGGSKDADTTKSEKSPKNELKDLKDKGLDKLKGRLGGGGG